MDDTTAVPDPCSLKRGSGVSLSVKEAKREHRTKARTFASKSAVNGREVGDEREESLELLELHVDTLQHAVAHCLDDG